MTADEIVRLIEQYRAGVEAELVLLHQLADVSSRQRSVTHAGDFDAFGHAADERDRIMQSLVTIEEGLRSVRLELAAHRQLAMSIDGFESVLASHHEATALVSSILADDQALVSALADAELARRSAVASLERGETTLAAYRRVLAPPLASASLLNRRG
ncbi:MAG: hypothetical protein ABI051_11720 [Vicinamibacterales bacterium]